MTETELQRSIVLVLGGQRNWVIRTGVSGKRSSRGQRTGERGMPDLWTPYGWLEVKLPGRDLDPDQVEWHRKAKEHGVNVAVVRSPAEACQVVHGWKMALKDNLYRELTLTRIC